jgi:Putative polyhydroxyalkanoic acid system protein (PHA_gran_rgn)
MAKPLVVSIPHSLGTQEAARRLRQGVGQMKSQFGDKIVSLEDQWAGDRMDFQVATMGQTVTGHLDVMEDCVRVEVQLPWVLEKIAEKAKSFIRKQGTNMLEKK